MKKLTNILTINGGSSSIKFALYRMNEVLEKILTGQIDRIGLPGMKLIFNYSVEDRKGSVDLATGDYKTAVGSLIDWLETQDEFSSVVAIGHRIVHGMQHTEPEIVTQELLEELHRIKMYDPNHLPGEIELIEAFRQQNPELTQIVCFDTAFHGNMPRVAKLLSIPRRYEAKGMRRYGFHGLSYSYLMQELEGIEGARVANGRVILAHLGNGASMAAVKKGRSLDTTMAFTPAAGLMMSTRSGDIDPGLLSFLARTEQMTALQFDHMVNHESGLLGVSEISSDMQDLLFQEEKDVRASEAVDLFCYQAKKQIGAYAATLDGLDTLVFAGGIGENSPAIRYRICEGLTFLGIELNEEYNKQSKGLISTEASQVAVRVIKTDEEYMIAKIVLKSLALEG